MPSLLKSSYITYSHFLLSNYLHSTTPSSYIVTCIIKRLTYWGNREGRNDRHTPRKAELGWAMCSDRGTSEASWKLSILHIAVKTGKQLANVNMRSEVSGYRHPRKGRQSWYFLYILVSAKGHISIWTVTREVFAILLSLVWRSLAIPMFLSHESPWQLCSFQ